MDILCAVFFLIISFYLWFPTVFFIAASKAIFTTVLSAFSQSYNSDVNPSFLGILEFWTSISGTVSYLLTEASEHPIAAAILGLVLLYMFLKQHDISFLLVREVIRFQLYIFIVLTVLLPLGGIWMWEGLGHLLALIGGFLFFFVSPVAFCCYVGRDVDGNGKH